VRAPKTRAFPFLAAAAVVALAVGWEGPLQAACQPSPVSLVWSYPKEGQTEVPTNATFWFLLSNALTPEVVFIDDAPLRPNPFGFGFEPAQPLAPNSAHVISFLATPEDVEPPVQLTVRFTTGAGPLEEESPEAPFVTVVSASSMRALTPRCQAVVQAMGCFDAGQNTHVVFATAGRPLLWMIERVPAAMDELATFTLWPGDCGPPEVFAGEDIKSACAHHYRLHAISAAGLRVEGKPICPNELLGPRPGESDGGTDPTNDPNGSVGGEADAGMTDPTDGAAGTRPGGNPSGVQVHEQSGSIDGRGCSFASGRSCVDSALFALFALAVLARRRR